MTRPDFCENEDEPHALNWVADNFAICPGCNMLFARQPGVLVWVYDKWACALADELARHQTTLAAADLGYRPDDPVPLPADDDL